jgi:hypothetical protein
MAERPALLGLLEVRKAVEIVRIGHNGGPKATTEKPQLWLVDALVVFHCSSLDCPRTLRLSAARLAVWARIGSFCGNSQIDQFLTLPGFKRCCLASTPRLGPIHHC